jgi:hypothetical protein
VGLYFFFNAIHAYRDIFLFLKSKLKQLLSYNGCDKFIEEPNLGCCIYHAFNTMYIELYLICSRTIAFKLM